MLIKFMQKKKSITELDSGLLILFSYTILIKTLWKDSNSFHYFPPQPAKTSMILINKTLK